MSVFLLAWCAVACVVPLVALLRLALRRPPAAAVSPAEVLLLRPVDAPTEQELLNLTVPLEGVQQVVISSKLIGPRWLPSHPSASNRKLAHLQHALKVLAPGEHQLVLAVDADVEVDRALVEALTGALRQGAGLAWAAPAPGQQSAVRGLLVQSLQNARVLDVLCGGRKPVCGKALGLSPAAQRALAALPDCAGEDLELARAVHAARLPIVLAGTAHLPGPPPGWNAALARFSRWMQVLRAHRPGLFLTVPWVMACTPLLCVAAVVGDSAVRAAVGAVLLARFALACALEGKVRPHLAWLLGELLLLTAWAKSWLLGPRLLWRGRVLRLGPGGRLGEPS